MTTASRRRALAGLLGLAALPLLAACPGAAGDDAEVEDCDAEDRRNREAECGYPQPARPDPTPATRRRRRPR